MAFSSLLPQVFVVALLPGPSKVFPLIAFHLDLKTIHYRLDYLAELVSRLAGAGYTHVFIELEDKVALDTLRGATWCEAWTKEQFAQVLWKIRSVGMTAVPLIQTLGHLEFVLSHSDYHNLRELPSSAYQLCPSNPASLAFMLRYMDEVGELFCNPPLIHLGADEAWSLGSCPDCAKRVASSSKSQLFQEYMAKLFGHAISRGWRPIAWADMLLAHRDSSAYFSRDTIWMDWDYWTQDQGPQIVRDWTTGAQGALDMLTPEFRDSEVGKYAFAEDGTYRPWFYTDYLIDKGFDVIIAPATRCGGDHVFAPSIKHLGNVMSAVNRMNQSPRPLGMMVSSWALRLNHLETQWPALFIPQAAKEQGSLRWREMASVLTEKAFGADMPAFFDAWAMISPSVALAESQYALENDIHYYGEHDSIPTFLHRLDEAQGLACERECIERQLPDYQRGQELLGGLMQNQSQPCRALRLWQFAAKAILARAQEEMLFLDAHEGNLNRKRAEAYLLRIESLQDEYRDLLLETATPASVNRELGMVFASSWRHLARLAAVDTDKAIYATLPAAQLI